MTGRRRRRALRARSVLAAAITLTASVVGLGGVQSGSGAATPSWRVAQAAVPPAPARVELAALSCPAPATCLAVGRIPYSGALFGARSDGASWSFVPAQTPSRAQPALTNIACASPTTCFAVGQSGEFPEPTLPLMEQWDGTRWTIGAAPKPPAAKQAQLTGVACRGPSFCMVIGTSSTSTSSGYLDTPYSARWNGHGWSVIATAAPEPHATFSLTRVSCWSPTGCFAVGNHSVPLGGIVTFTERWNGRHWLIVPSASPPEIANSSADNKLVDVSCPSSEFCFAVGYYLTSDDLAVYQRPYALRWNGSQWKLLRIPLPPRRSTVARSVSCADATMCLTGGWMTRWDGSKWDTAPRPPLGGIIDVACRTPTKCIGVGGYSASYATTSFFAARFDGTEWKQDRPPPGGSQTQLWGVSCPEPNFCLAVGDLAVRKTLAVSERWNGSRWSVVQPAVPPKTTESTWRTISCASKTSCIAVGTYRSPGRHVLAERWNGTNWEIIPAPTGDVSRGLSGLSCPSNTLCMGTNGDTWKWNGASWSRSDDLPSGTGVSAVSCASASDCMAAGQGGSGLIARRWNGTSWSPVAMPAPPGSFPTIASLSCAAPDSCVAIGNAYDQHSSPTDRSFVERWNGAAWTVESKPSVKQTNPVLLGVSCASATSCALVGTAGKYGPVIEQWNGSAWSLVPSPHRPGSGGDILGGVACPSATSCFAVGTSQTDRYWLPLILRYG